MTGSFYREGSPRDRRWRCGCSAAGLHCIQSETLSVFYTQGPAAALLLPPLAVRLSCGATLAAGRIGGSLASTLEWLPRPPHDLLLVGHWDGTAALWRLAPPAAGSDAR